MSKDKQRKYLVFLDIDGVLASNRVHFSWDNEYDKWSKFDPVAVDFFNKIWDRYPVEFVLMSTWKKSLDVNDEMITHWIMSAFKNSGFRGRFSNPWKTNPTNDPLLEKCDRATEVKSYLNTFASDVSDYILFDDERHNFKSVMGKSRLIQTNPSDGLLYRHMKDAHSLMGLWQER